MPFALWFGLFCQENDYTQVLGVSVFFMEMPEDNV